MCSFTGKENNINQLPEENIKKEIQLSNYVPTCLAGLTSQSTLLYNSLHTVYVIRHYKAMGNHIFLNASMYN